MLKPLRVAIVGHGRWGKNIVKTLRKLPECTIAHIEENDYRNLLPRRDIDAVIVATPGTTHARVALPFIKKGLPVFIEKPLATKLADAKKIKSEAEKSGSLVFVGHIYRYSNAYEKTKSLSKKIGRIRYLFGEGAGNGPYRDDMSALWDHAPHDIYSMLGITKTLPRSVQAWGSSLLRPKTPLHDVGFIKLNFPKGVEGFILNSWLLPEKRRRLTVVGEKSSLIFDNIASKKVILYKNMGPKVSKKTVLRKEPVVSYPSYKEVPPLTAELKTFLTRARKNKNGESNLGEGLAVVQVLDAIEKSIKSRGKQVQVAK